MAKVRLDDGREFDLVQRASFAEASWMERQCGRRMQDWMDAELQCSGVVLTLRRNGVMVTWKDVWEDVGAYEVIADGDEDEPVDPTSPPPSRTDPSTSAETTI